MHRLSPSAIPFRLTFGEIDGGPAQPAKRVLTLSAPLIRVGIAYRAVRRAARRSFRLYASLYGKLSCVGTVIATAVGIAGASRGGES